MKKYQNYALHLQKYFDGFLRVLTALRLYVKIKL